MRVIFDLDGTLALIEHRRHYVDGTGPEKSWPKFFQACDKDLPNHPIINTLLALEAAGHSCEIWSGRSGEVGLRTKLWLQSFGLGHVPLKMRYHDDYRPDDTLKEEWLDAAIAAGNKPDLVFDDRDKVVSMWRRRGIPCAQVAPGDF